MTEILWFRLLNNNNNNIFISRDNIFGTNASVTWSSITKVEMTLAIEYA